jgi:hypothetical protein
MTSYNFGQTTRRSASFERMDTIRPLLHVNLALARTKSVRRHEDDHRSSLRRLTSSKQFQHAVIALIALDVSLIIACLLLESFYPEYELMTVSCTEGALAQLAPNALLQPDQYQNVEGLALAVASAAVSTGTTTLHSPISKSKDSPRLPPPPSGCVFEEKKSPPEAVHNAVNILEWISVGIICVMVLEILVTVYAFGWEWCTLVHLLDATIVVASLVRGRVRFNCTKPLLSGINSRHDF